MADIFLKPINRAAQVYTSGPSFQRTHRQQHQFILVYNLYTDVVDNFLADRVKYLIAYRDRLHFLCNQVESPKLETDQDVFNQYNRKRVINRKVTFSPVNVRMYDTHDGMALKFAKTLYEFEFQNARLYKESNEQYNYEQSVLVDDSQFRETHEYGMRSHSSQRHRLIKSIDLYQVAGGTYSKTRMVHPRLQRFDMDTFDFSSSQLVNVSLSFNYENLLFEEINVPIAQAEYDLPRLFEESAQGLYDTAPPLVNDLPEPPETKLEPDVPTPVNNTTQSDINNTATPTTSTGNNGVVTKETSYSETTKAQVVGLVIDDNIRESSEWQQFYDEPVVKTSNSERLARKKADEKYKKAVIRGDIDPPEENKMPNYEIRGREVESTVPTANNPNNTTTTKTSSSGNTQTVTGNSRPLNTDLSNVSDEELDQMKIRAYENKKNYKGRLASTQAAKRNDQVITNIDAEIESRQKSNPDINSNKITENDLTSSQKRQLYRTGSTTVDGVRYSRAEIEANSSLQPKGSQNYDTVASPYGNLNQDSFLEPVTVTGSGGKISKYGQIKDSNGVVRQVPMSEYKSLKGQLVDENNIAYD